MFGESVSSADFYASANSCLPKRCEINVGLSSCKVDERKFWWWGYDDIYVSVAVVMIVTWPETVVGGFGGCLTVIDDCLKVPK